MPAFYGATQTLFNTDTTLTAEQFGDRADVFCMVLSANDLVDSVDVVVVGNRELDITVVAEVPEGTDPKSYVETTIGPLVSAALDTSDLDLDANAVQHAPTAG